LKEFQIFEKDGKKFIEYNNELIEVPKYLKKIVTIKDLLILQDNRGEIIDIIKYDNLETELKSLNVFK
jgi:hypothetical protein